MEINLQENFREIIPITTSIAESLKIIDEIGLKNCYEEENSFVSRFKTFIFQISLLDLLSQLNIHPDYIETQEFYSILKKYSDKKLEKQKIIENFGKELSKCDSSKSSGITLISENCPIESKHIEIIDFRNCYNASDILVEIGKAYTKNISINFNNLFRLNEFPVKSGTQSISSIIQLDHSQNHFVPKFPDYIKSSQKLYYRIPINWDCVEDMEHWKIAGMLF